MFLAEVIDILVGTIFCGMIPKVTQVFRSRLPTGDSNLEIVIFLYCYVMILTVTWSDS